MKIDVFSLTLQNQLISFMLSDPESFAISRDIVSANLFDRSLKPVMSFILEYSDSYSTLPTFDMVEASTGVKIQQFAAPQLHRQWYLDTVEHFVQKRTLTDIIMSYSEALAENKEFKGDIVKSCQDALSISLIKNLGTNLFVDAEQLIEDFKQQDIFVSTGFTDIDTKLYGGFAESTLNIFVGRSGEGKSLMLQNLAINWAAMGKNVIYFSLELSESLIGRRLISMVSNMSTVEVLKNSKEACTRVKLFGKSKQAGNLIVKELPVGSTTNTLRAFIKEYSIKTGIIPDCIVVDYLDIMFPNEKNIDVSNLFTKDKYVSEQLRGLAQELNIPLATASQFNRQATDTEEFDYSHIAGGISKINTADNVIWLNAPASFKEKGEFHIVFGKTRSSNAQGSHIKLRYNNETMRISDWDGLPDVNLDYTELEEEDDSLSTLMNMPQ